MDPDIAILIPCYNEEQAIAKVVSDFKQHVPGCNVFVYDNASTDRTVEVALAAGAIVRREPLPGKGNVVRRMFADIEADVYVLVDGDDTYDAASAPALISKLLTESLDLVTGARTEVSQEAYRRGHRFGNWLLTSLVASLFGNRFSDMLSGYRVFSRRFVKSFPALSAGFEIETELTVHALQVRVPIAEISTPYKDRPPGSHSKLRTVSDGARILSTIVRLVKEERPLYFFGLLGAVFLVASIVAGYPVVADYFRTGLVPRLPTAVLATGLAVIAFLNVVCGLILDTVTKGRLEAKRMHYLRIPIRLRAGPPIGG
jgi:glycosyltransferase involved in cell wall biosynthesis